METGPPLKHPLTLALMAAVILAPAAVFAVTGDAPQTLVLAAAGLAGSAVRRRPLPRSTRSLVYAGVAVLAAVTLSEMVFPVAPERFFLLPSHIYCPLLILLAAALTWLDQRESHVSGVVGLSLLAMMLAGNCMDFSTPYRRLPIRAGMYRHLLPGYAGAVAVQLGAAVALMARAAYVVAPAARRDGLAGLRRALVAGLLALVAAGTVLMRPLARSLEGFYQSRFEQFLRLGLRPRHGTRFAREVDLWQPAPADDPALGRVVLRALSREPPGYLRARAYLHYNNGRWTGPGPGNPLPFEQPGGHLAYSVFRRPPDRFGPALRRVDIYPDRSLRSEVLFVPGDSTVLELVADSLSHNDHGELTPEEWDPAVGYTAAGPETPPESAFQGPGADSAALAECLVVPDALREALAPFSAEAFDGAAPGDAPAALAALNRFFGRTFRYELGTVPNRTGDDPVLQFLRRRTGHCELFATAAVLLLRTRGIPARCVTGLVCLERAARGQWVARLADAHAWAEAYDAQADRWRLVEVTPAAGIPRGEDRFGLLAAPLDRFAFAWQHVLALMKRGTVAAAIMALAGGLLRGVLWLLFSPVGTPLTVLAATLAFRRWRRARARRLAADLTAPRERLRRVYLGSLPALRRLLPECPPRPTPGFLARRLRESFPGAEGDPLAGALERYQTLRYGREPPSDSDVRSLRQALRAGLRQARNSPRSQQPAGTR